MDMAGSPKVARFVVEDASRAPVRIQAAKEMVSPGTQRKANKTEQAKYLKKKPANPRPQTSKHHEILNGPASVGKQLVVAYND